MNVIIAGSVCARPNCGGVIERRMPRPIVVQGGLSKKDSKYQKTWRLGLRYVCTKCGMKHIPDEQGNVGRKKG